jgi:hypothetical protein
MSEEDFFPEALSDRIYEGCTGVGKPELSGWLEIP